MRTLSLKNQILLFLALTFLISWGLQYLIIKNGDVYRSSLVFVLMWTPGSVGLFLSWLFNANFKDIGFKFGSRRYYSIAYAIPALAAVLILAGLIVFGLGSFQISPKFMERIWMVVLAAPTLGALLSSIPALGEEIGWRGFLHTRLLELKVPHPFLLTGIVWAIWHWPLILFSNYATSDLPVVSLILFTITVTSFAVFMGWLRLRSGSVFTAALAHGAHNLWIQSIYPMFLKKGPYDQYWGGESGILIAILYFGLAICIYKINFCCPVTKVSASMGPYEK